MIKLPPNHNEDYLFLVLIHEIQKEFSNHAILKGGMVLKLLGSNRKTLDLDYTFIPFKSKNDVLDDLKKLCTSIEGASVQVSLNSKAIRLIIKTEKASVQVEVQVSQKCKSVPMSTKELSKEFTLAPRVIKVMSYDTSLANKLAAWFERRLMRDLYDIYFLSSVAGPIIDMPILLDRLSHVESRIPQLKKIKKVKLSDFFSELKKTTADLEESDLRNELTGFLVEAELTGLHLKMRKIIFDLISKYNEE